MGSRAEVILDGRAHCTPASEDMVWVADVGPTSSQVGLRINNVHNSSCVHSLGPIS